MSRYFFHVRNDEDVRTDYNGVILPDFRAAVAWALKTAREILSDEALEGSAPMNGHIEVEDQLGARVHHLFLIDAVDRDGRPESQIKGQSSLMPSTAAIAETKMEAPRNECEAPLAIKGRDGSKAMRAFRYRTAVIAGAWRNHSDDAVQDAVRAGQARRGMADRELTWLVNGTIEMAPKTLAMA